MKEMDPLVWFGTRELTNTPRHFVKTNTPAKEEARLWVLTTLKGRFSLVSISDSATLASWGSYYYFEDPAEAMLYELRWSGN